MQAQEIRLSDHRDLETEKEELDPLISYGGGGRKGLVELALTEKQLLFRGKQDSLKEKLEEIMKNIALEEKDAVGGLALVVSGAARVDHPPAIHFVLP